jgi:hypothetical protein
MRAIVTRGRSLRDETRYILCEVKSRALITDPTEPATNCKTGDTKIRTDRTDSEMEANYN